MQSATHPQHDARERSGSPAVRWALAVFVAVAAFYLWTEHRAHLMGALPYVLILACPLSHFFMHRGHGGHGAGPEERQHGGAS